MAQTPVIPVREQIANYLRTEIITGELAPNQKLTEELLAQRFGVSRGRIRDVLLELSKEGLLVARANKGTTVNDVAAPDLLALLVKLRFQIESYAVRKVVRHANAEAIANLEAACQELVHCLENGAFAEATKADINFHRLIVFAAGGDDLVNLWQPVIMRMRMNFQRITSVEQFLSEHYAIFDAISAGDEKAAIDALKANIR